MLSRNRSHCIIFSETNVKPLFSFIFKLHYNYIKKIIIVIASSSCIGTKYTNNCVITLDNQFNYNLNDDRDLFENLLVNMNEEFEHNLKSSASQTRFHVMYKKLKTSFVGALYINDVNNTRKMSIIMKLRGELLNLN